MKQIVKDFTNDIFRQLFGWSKPRQGKIILTRYAIERMREYGIDFETIEDVFRHGEGKAHKIVQKYANVIVGLYYKVEKSKTKQSKYCYIITTCWKGSGIIENKNRLCSGLKTFSLYSSPLLLRI